MIPARGTKGMFSRTDVQKTSAGVGFQHIGQRRPILGGRLFDYLLALKWKWCFFFVVAPPGLFRPDVVHETFFAIA